MKKPISRKVILWAVFVPVFVLVIVGTAFPPTGGVLRPEAQWESVLKMQGIALVLYAFSIDHGGSLPSRLAELFPDYLGDPQSFFPKGKYSRSFTPKDAATHPELIDLFSPYSFFKIPDGRIVVAERPGLWDDGKISFLTRGKTRELIEDQTAYRVAPEKLEEMLKRDFQMNPVQSPGITNGPQSPR